MGNRCSVAHSTHSLSCAHLHDITQVLSATFFYLLFLNCALVLPFLGWTLFYIVFVAHGELESLLNNKKGMFVHKEDGRVVHKHCCWQNTHTHRGRQFLCHVLYNRPPSPCPPLPTPRPHSTESLKERLSTAVFVRAREGSPSMGAPCLGLPLPTQQAPFFRSARRGAGPSRWTRGQFSHTPLAEWFLSALRRLGSQGPNDVKWMPVRPSPQQRRAAAAVIISRWKWILYLRLLWL